MAGRSELAGETLVHRLGGNSLERFRLKPKDRTAEPPGISVLLGGTPEQAVAQMLAAYGDPRKHSGIHEMASVVATATVEAIRETGFDVIPKPTKKFLNHGRIVHPSGIDGFSDENLAALAAAFDTAGC